MKPEQHNRYRNLMHSMVSMAESYINKAVSAEKAGEIIANTLTKKRQRPRYTIGSDTSIVRVLNWLLLDSVFDSLLAQNSKAHYPKTS